MKVLNIGHIENYVCCNNCGTELQYDYKDVMWSHTEEDMYYIKCPICGKNIWLVSTPELDTMWEKHWNEISK